MIQASLMLRIIGAVLIGVWLFGGLVAVLNAWRKTPQTSKASVTEPTHSVANFVSVPVQALSPDTLNLTDLPIWWLDRDLRLAGANDAYARAVAHPTADGAVRDNTEIVPGSRALAAEARATDRAIVSEERIIVSGETRVFQIIAIPLRNGEVAHLALDETARHAANMNAATHARALGEALDSLTTAIALFDSNEVLHLHNSAFAEMFALDRAWLSTGPELGVVLDAMHTAGRLPEERDFARWRAERCAWATRDVDRIDETWLLPGGQIFRVAVLSRGDAGLVMMVEDKTEYMRLIAGRDQLLAAQAAMLDHLQEGVAVFGPDGKLKLFNRRFAEIVIASPETLAAAPQAEKLMDHLARLLDEPERARGLRALIIGATAGREARSGRINSTLGFTIEYSAVPLPDGDALLIANAIGQPTSPI